MKKYLLIEHGPEEYHLVGTRKLEAHQRIYGDQILAVEDSFEELVAVFNQRVAPYG